MFEFISFNIEFTQDENTYFQEKRKKELLDIDDKITDTSIFPTTILNIPRGKGTLFNSRIIIILTRSPPKLIGKR